MNSYFAQKTAAAACAFSRLMRAPEALINKERQLSFFDDALLVKQQRRAAEAARKIEEARPPNFEVESLEEAKKRKERASIRRMERAARLFKVDWLRPEAKMGAKPFLQEREELREAAEGPRPQRPFMRTLYERIQYAEFRGYQTMRIAGIEVPAINGHFFQYLPILGEMRAQWRSRIWRLRKGANFGKKVAKEQAMEDLPLFEQIKRRGQALGQLKNPYSKLGEVLLGPVGILTHSHWARGKRSGFKQESENSYWTRFFSVRKEKKLRVFGPIQKFRVDYQDQCAKRKLRLALYQDEWKEARLLRREKMARALIVESNHQVKPLKGLLEKEILQFIKMKNVRDLIVLEKSKPEGQMLGLWGAKDKVDETIQKVDNIASKIDDKLIDEIKSTSANAKSITETIKGLFSSNCPTFEGVQDKIQKWVSLIINAITNLCHCLINFNLKSLGVAVISFLVQLKVICFSFTDAIASKLAGLFNCLSRDASSQPNLGVAPEGQMEIADLERNKEKDSLTCAYVSTLVAAVASLFAFSPKFCKARIDQLGSLLLDGIGKFAFTANHLFTFVKNNLICIKKIGEWLFSDHPSIKKLGFLKNYEDIYMWAEDVINYTDPRKENEVFCSPRKATSVYILAAQAGVLQIKMLDLNLTSSQSQVLCALIKKIQDLRDRLAKTHTAPPVRFEPFVYELTGRTGIGKSELLKSLPYTLFQALNLKNEGDLIYHRAIGNAYWNNLRNQPVCTIDEKFPIDAPGFSDVQMAELFQLKSSCIFNPPMADLPDKNIRYNPIIVQGSSNDPFPNLQGVKTPEALFRRRDVLIRVEVKPSIRVNLGADCTYPKIRDAGLLGKGEFDYLQFSIHKDPKNGSDSIDDWEAPMDYSEFTKELVKRFKFFFTNEEKKFRKEILRMQTILPESDEDKTLQSMFDYKWLDSQEKLNRNFDVDVAKYREEYQGLNKFISEGALYYKKLRLLNLETFWPDLVEEKNKLAREIAGIPVTDRKVNPVSDELNRKISSIEKEIAANQLIIDSATSNEIKNAHAAQNVALLDKLQSFSKVYKDLEGNAGYSCPHVAFLHAMSYFPQSFTFKLEKSGWEYECDSIDKIAELYSGLNIAAGNTETLDQFKNIFKDSKVLEYDDKLGVVVIKYLACGSDDCIMKTREQRIEFVSTLNRVRPDLGRRLMNGMPGGEYFPPEFIESVTGIQQKKIEEHKKLEEKMPEFKSYWQKFKENFYNIKWLNWLKKLAIALSIFGFIGGVIGLWNFYSGSTSDMAVVGATVGVSSATAASKLVDSDNYAILCEQVKDIAAQGHVSGDYKVSKLSKHKNNPAIKSIQSLFKVEANAGIIHDNIVNEKIMRNTFFIDTDNELSIRNPGRCLGICGRYAIVVDHFMDAWKFTSQKLHSDKMMFIPVINGSVSMIRFNLSDISYSKIDNSALGIIKLPKRIPNFKNIINLFPSKSTHRVLNKRGVIAEVGLSRNEIIQVNRTIVDYEQYSDEQILQVPGSELWEPFSVYNAYRYEGFSGKGKCGSLLLAHGIQSPIIAIHVAGYPSTNIGIGDLVYREMFEQLGNQLDPVTLMGQGLLSNWFVDSEVIGIGKVSGQFAHQERGKSRIVPSFLQLKDLDKQFKIYTEPAVLTDRDPRIKENPFSPMLEGCKFHGLPLKSFSKELINLATTDYLRKILANCKPERQNVGLLTVDEAIGGFDGKPGYEHIEFSTSEGFPFTGLRPSGYSNKKWLFNFDENNKYISCNDKLSNVLALKWQQRLNGKIPNTVFVDCLKDCTVAKEKVLLPGKTRIFSMSSVDFTIQQRQCTLDFVVAFMKHRLNLEHMVGCNPDSIEWTWLAQNLQKVGPYIVTGDYSKYGDSLPKEFIFAAFQIIRDWYKFNGCQDHEMFKQLEVMPYEIGNSVHLMFDYLYQVVCGQPSGNSLTVVINSIANSLYIRVAYLAIMKETEYNSLKDFNDNVSLYSYGDDLILSLSHKIKDLFNATHLHKFFGDHNLKFTNADKSNNIVPYTSLFEAEFLKRGFVPHPKRNCPKVMLAPLSYASIEDTVNWVWSDSFQRSDPECQAFKEMSIQVCEDSLRNAFGRGEDYYNDWRSKLTKFWLKHKVNFVAPEWVHMDHKIFGLGLDLSPYHKWTVKLEAQMDPPKVTRDVGTQTNCWSMPNSPEFPRRQNLLLSVPRISITKEDYQGYGPHDFHWPPYQQFKPEGQMAETGKDAHGKANAAIDKKSNVEIQQQAGTSIGSALPGGTPKNSYSNLSAAESKVTDSTFHDRWYTFKSLMWDNTQNEGSAIVDLELPKDILEDKKFKMSPNYTAYAKHMFASFRNLKIKIIANTNCRQYGQIQWSFYYGAKQDYLYQQLRKNYYIASQRLHALTTANESNEVIINIPFEYVFPMMAVNKVKLDGYKTLGNFLGLVIVPLTAPSTCPQEASIKLLCSFEGNRFAGMVGQSIAEGQMLSLASIIAVKSLLDKNRDAPTVVAPGTPVIPINSSSWCHGTGQATYNNVLRLDPNHVLPYEEGRIPAIDEMTIDHIKKQFGMVGRYKWQNSQAAGTFLYSMDATPLTDIREYQHITFQDRSVYIVPPVGVLSSLFAYWRGSLEFRIDVVGATELSGSLLVAYIPQYNSDDHSRISMEDCYSCAHAIYDIKENRQFIFKIPYVASHMFWPRRSTLSYQYPVYAAPGAIFVFVYNKLIVNCTIPPECHLIMYLRGGDDFEVAIPASPSVGLSFNPFIYVPSTANKRIVPIEGFTPNYSGWWRYSEVDGYTKSADFAKYTLEAFNTSSLLNTRITYYVPTVRYGDLSDHVAQYKAVHFTIKPYKIYLVEIKSELKGKFIYKNGDNAAVEKDVKYLLISGDETYVYARCLASEWKDNAEKALKWLDSVPSAGKSKYDVNFIWLGIAMVSDNLTIANTSSFTAPSSNWWTPVDYYCVPIYPVDPQAEAGDEKSTTEAPVASPQQTAQSSVSKAVFGEQFRDLKDLCRRFQLYASSSLVIDKLLQSNKWRSIVIRFPVVPQGLDLDLGTNSNPNEYWNRTRDGPIQVIASGFRFFTGGIRYRVCINVSKKSKSQAFAGELRGKIFVQHRPNVISTAKRVIIQSGVTLGTDDLELPGYAAYHQFEDLNNVLSIEVPFYQPSLRTYLQRPSKVDLAQRFSDLGELVIGVTVFDFDQLNFNYDIYYSLADDARFSVFIGFPPVIDISRIPELEPSQTQIQESINVQATQNQEIVALTNEELYKSYAHKYKTYFGRDLEIKVFKTFDLEHQELVLKETKDNINRYEASLRGFEVIEP